MPLRRKLFLAMLIPALLIAAMGAVGIYSVRHLEQAAGRILSENYASIQDARRMEHALRTLELLADRMCAGGAARAEAAPRSAAADVAAQQFAAFGDALRRCEANLTEEGEHVVIAGIGAAWGQLAPRLADALRGDAPAGACGGALDGAALHAGLDTLVALNEEAMFVYEAETRHVARLMVASVSGVLVATLCALALFALISAGRIARPITQVADRLHEALNPVDAPPPLPAAPPLAAAPSLPAAPPIAAAAGHSGTDEIERLREELEALLGRLGHYEDEQNRRLVDAQGRLALVMNEVLEGLVLLDGSLRILAVNRVGRALLGAESAEGRRLDELEVDEDIAHALAPIRDGTFRAERDLGEVTHEVDGQERIYRPRVLPVGGGAGAGGAGGYLVLFWDVTEARQLEESRRRFISMLSHELKTPMTSLRMSVDLLRERLSPADDAQAELLAIAADDCGALSRLVSDLIDAARDATPDLSLRPRRIDLVRLVRYALRPLRPQAEEKGITLETPDESARVFADVDPVKFPWIVTNIAGNGIRYTGPGGRLTVTVAEAADAIEVCIRDTGAGIPAEHLEHIFEPYVSVDAEPQAGTHGLGLAIAREIVEAHGGTIAAESRLGEGTAFRIRLPRAKASGEKRHA